MPRNGDSSKANGRITTTGQLRAFLADTIAKVSSGEVGIEEASRITKLASQINESFYSEIKVAKTLWEMGQYEKVEMGERLIE